MKAMVLCAGFGTRLRPFTDVVPKPLVPLCGLPLLQYNFALLRAASVREVVINTHHLGAEMERGARELAAKLGVDLAVSREERHILGTGGGLRRAAALLGEGTFFLFNGDMIFDLDLAAALAAHRAANAVATMVLAPVPAGGSYGVVEVDAQDRVRRIAGRGASPPAPGEPPLQKRHFTGVHVLETAILSRLPADGESDINRTAYVRLIHEGAPVHGFLQRGYWGDLGAPKSLLRANLDFLGRRVPMEHFGGLADPWLGARELSPGVFVHDGTKVARGATLVGPALVHAGCEIADGATVGPEAVLGAGVRVDGGASVRRAVCWERTHVGAGERLGEIIAAPGVRMDAA
jgi:mannose-1-phosphate guanylyltransferase